MAHKIVWPGAGNPLAPANGVARRGEEPGPQGPRIPACPLPSLGRSNVQAGSPGPGGHKEGRPRGLRAYPEGPEGGAPKAPKRGPLRWRPIRPWPRGACPKPVKLRVESGAHSRFRAPPAGRPEAGAQGESNFRAIYGPGPRGEPRFFFPEIGSAR